MKQILTGAVIVLTLSAGTAGAQTTRSAFPAKDGEAVFKSICQGCHMPDAKGATGAGTYPALAGNPNLAAAAFPIVMVINGRKAMPPFGGMLSDQQVADVVNYIRTHFGNRYKDKASLQDPKPPTVRVTGNRDLNSQQPIHAGNWVRISVGVPSRMHLRTPGLGRVSSQSRLVKYELHLRAVSHRRRRRPAARLIGAV